MKIVFLTSVEDLDGYGGGNQRSKHLFDSLKSVVTSESELERITLPYNSFDDLEIQDASNLYMAQDIEFAMRLSWALKNRNKKAEEFVNKIESSDFVLVDNCYHYPLIETLKSRLKSFPKIIYLSQNHEYSLKSEIAEFLGWELNSKKRYLEFVRRLELKSWVEADFRIVCSASDALSLNHESGLTMKSHLIPNGANKGSSGPIRGSKAFSHSLGCESYVLFVSSGHPPNVRGFHEMLGGDFGFIPPNSRLVIVGSSGPIIVDSILGTKHWETFRNRVSVLDTVTELELEELYSNCSGILLPILQGSGTSIKAIEAVLTGKKVIGTEFAFRGLPPEVYVSRQVALADSLKDFRINIVKALITEHSDFNPDKIAYNYLWSSQLGDTSNIFGKIILGETE